MKVQASDHVSFKEVDGTVVVLDIREGSYWGLDEVASRIWLSMVTDRETFNQCAMRLCTLYACSETTIRADMTRFLSSCLERGLIATE
jgi:hypothetical protein